jgi:hypothetical protein
MNIDFHYGIIYVVSRLAGLPVNEATIVAHACQYVDDATTNGILDFADGETYERFSSAHDMLDYKNLIDDQDRLVWAPFHFLPGGQGDTLEEKAICRPDSEIARAMMRRAIEGKKSNNSLHRLGISLHVYVDTWAHQGFSGMRSELNAVKSLSGDDHDHDKWFEALKGYLVKAGHDMQSNFLDVISKLGHGAALHFPDMPWANWEYVNGRDAKIVRNNLPDFMAAANMACKVVQGYIKGNSQYEIEPGLTAAQFSALEKLLKLNQSHDSDIRLDNLCIAVAKGEISGLKEEVPLYIPKGDGSWKHAATGILVIDDGNRQNKPKWSTVFENSDYRKFHDAVKQHRFVITQEILPLHNVRIA